MTLRWFADGARRIILFMSTPFFVVKSLVNDKELDRKLVVFVVACMGLRYAAVV